MRLKSNTQNYINKCISIHGEKYNYSKVVYEGASKNITIICKEHGEFQQRADVHLSGSGCKKCNLKNRKTCTISTEEFIRRAKLKHGNKYNYSNVNYIHSHKKINILCPKHGEFSIIPSAHIIGQGCKKCWLENCGKPGRGNDKKALMTTKQFIEKARIKHNNFYDYSVSEYTKSSNKIDIICPVHGKFTQIAMTHLRGHGCKKCGDKTPKFKKELSKKKSIEELFENFINKATKKHNNKYDYSLVDYKNSSEKVKIICPKHGIFEQTPFGHLQTGGCKLCWIEKFSKNSFYTKEDFIEKAKNKHNNIYDYSLVNYITSKSKVKIICLIHGIFEQEPRSHLQGQGCPQCKRYQGYDKTSWVNHHSGKEGVFYIIKCWNNEEEFYKIGITGNSVKERYNYKNSMPYNWEIFKEVKSFDLDYIWNFEKEEKNRLKDYHYNPKIKFPGCSKECFSKIII